MAPKKEGKKAKGDDDDGPDQHEMASILEAHVDALKQRLVLEQERCNASNRKEDQVRKTEIVMDGSLEAHRIKTAECIAEMTHSYDLMEKDFRVSITN